MPGDAFILRWLLIDSLAECRARSWNHLSQSVKAIVPLSSMCHCGGAGKSEDILLSSLSLTIFSLPPVV